MAKRATKKKIDRKEYTSSDVKIAEGALKSENPCSQGMPRKWTYRLLQLATRFPPSTDTEAD